MTATTVPTKVCAQCGETFSKPPKLTHAEWDKRRCCSAACSDGARVGRKPPGRPALAVEDATVVPAVADQSWRTRAACANRDDIEIVGEARTRGRRPGAWMGQIKALCRICPVDASCLAYGLATNSYGVWGGQYLTPETRARIRATSSSTA